MAMIESPHNLAAAAVLAGCINDAAEHRMHHSNTATEVEIARALVAALVFRGADGGFFDWVKVERLMWYAQDMTPGLRSVLRLAGFLWEDRWQTNASNRLRMVERFHEVRDGFVITGSDGEPTCREGDYVVVFATREAAAAEIEESAAMRASNGMDEEHEEVTACRLTLGEHKWAILNNHHRYYPATEAN